MAAALDAVALVTARVRITVETGRARALVASRQVLAGGAETARRLVDGRLEALVDVATKTRLHVAHQAARADADAALASAVGGALLAIGARIGRTAAGW